MGKLRLLVLTVALLAVNAGYLYAFETPSLFYVINVFLHLGLGLAAGVLVLLYIRNSWKDLSLEGKLAAGAITLSFLSGAILVYTGTSRPYLAALNLHILISCVGVGLLVIHAAIRRHSWILAAGAAVAGLAIPIIVPMTGINKGYEIKNPMVVPTSMHEEGGGPDSPFWPSSANTNVNTTIPSDFFMESESCGEAGCHPDIFKQWQTSAHHIASFNNQWYRKSIEYMQDTVGTQPAKWCAGCHDHAMFFNGMMDQPVKDQLHKPEAHAGLGCVSCHSIVEVGSTMGNGSFVIEYPPLHDLATSSNPVLKWIHDFVVKIDPGPHRQTFMKPFMKEQTSEYCSACHKVHLDQPVNNYRWIRGFNEYDAWQSSGVSGEGARAFYYPATPKNCGDCHMPLVPSNDAGNINGVVHDHRFPGANTAIAVAHGFDDQLKLVTEFLQNDQVSIDIFALSEASEEEEHQAAPAAQETLQIASTFAEGDEMGLATAGRGAGYTAVREIVAPINRANPAVRRGDTVRVNAVLRTKNIGHFFPGGTVDAFEVWVELKAVDEKGQIIFWSGYVPEDEMGRKGPVDPSAHFYRSRMLDERGNLINKRNAWATRTVAYVRLVPPGAADTVHFRLDIPEDAGEKIFLTAKVNYRKFDWWNTQWSYAGVRDPNDPNPEIGPGYDDGKWVFTGDTSTVSGKVKEIPEIPIVTMAKAEAELKVLPKGATLPEQESVYLKEDLIRWNDYGIGLLLQGDLKAAEDVFLRVTEIDPGFADGWVNVGRVRVLEGRTEEAQEVLTKALEINPELAKTHFFLGEAYRKQGNYDQALDHYRKSESKYPRDRVVLNQIGRILFLQRKFEDAVQTLKRVLEVDAEDLQAHYNLMLSYRALRDQENAARAQKLYMRFKADESAQAITGPYLRDNPHDNNERQAIHEHGTYPLDQIRRDLSMTRVAAPPKEQAFVAGP